MSKKDSKTKFFAKWSKISCMALYQASCSGAVAGLELNSSCKHFKVNLQVSEKIIKTVLGNEKKKSPN